MQVKAISNNLRGEGKGHAREIEKECAQELEGPGSTGAAYV